MAKLTLAFLIGCAAWWMVSAQVFLKVEERVERMGDEAVDDDEEVIQHQEEVAKDRRREEVGFYPGDYECGPCEREECPAIRGCVAGLVRDRCGCCQECGKAEHELCHHPGVPTETSSFHGKCGENLECRLRTDLAQKDRPEAVCKCMFTDALCGTDGVTYQGLCALAASGIKNDFKISIATKGPCKTAPQIVTPPENTKDHVGNDASMVCEATGFPIPNVEWIWTRVDGKTVHLPSDDLHVSVNMRGGPEKWQITGWLQVMDIQEHHEGDYTCIAQNELGVVQAAARLKVINEKQNKWTKTNDANEADL